MEDKVGKSQQVKQKREREEKENRTVRKLGGQCRRNITRLTGLTEKDKRENSREDIIVPRKEKGLWGIDTGVWRGVVQERANFHHKIVVCLDF